MQKLDCCSYYADADISRITTIMNEITFRRCTADDIPALVAKRIEAIHTLAGPPEPGEEQPLKESLTRYFAEALPAQSYICWVASDKGRIVSIGGVAVRQHPGNFKNPEGKVGYVMSMYTDPAYRGRGISSQILIRLQETARSIGVRFFELHASNMGEPIYIKDGFKQHHEPTYRKTMA